MSVVSINSIASFNSVTGVDAAGNFGSPIQLLILLAIVLLLFGGNRLRNLGSDLGGAIKGFKNSMGATDAEKEKVSIHQEQSALIDSNIQREKNHHNLGG